MVARKAVLAALVLIGLSPAFAPTGLGAAVPQPSSREGGVLSPHHVQETLPEGEAPFPREIGTIINRVQENLLAVEDLAMTVRMTIAHNGGRSQTRAKGQLLGLPPHLFRLTFSEPDMLAGTILVVDVQQNEAWQYHPVTEEIVVQPWDRLARERNLELEFERWLGLPDPERYAFRRLDDWEMNGERYLVLEAVPREGNSLLRYRFYVHGQRWWVEQVQVIDAADVVVFTAQIEELAVDQGLSESSLREFPQGARIVRR